MALTHTDTNIENLKINKFNTLAEFEAAQAQSLIGNYDISLIGEVLQTDWGQNNSTKEDYIKNRTHYIDWNNTHLVELSSEYTFPMSGSILCNPSNMVEYNFAEKVRYNENGEYSLFDLMEYIAENLDTMTISGVTVFSGGGVTFRHETIGGEDFICGGNLAIFLDFFEPGGDYSQYDTGEDYVFTTFYGLLFLTNNPNYGLDGVNTPDVSILFRLPNIMQLNPIFTTFALPIPEPSDYGKLLSVNQNGHFELLSIVNSENISY